MLKQIFIFFIFSILWFSLNAFSMTPKVKSLMQRVFQCQESGKTICVKQDLEEILTINNPELTSTQEAMIKNLLRGTYFKLADNFSVNPTDSDLLTIEKYCLRGIELGQQLVASKFSKRQIFQTEEIVFNVKLTISYWETGRKSKATKTAKKASNLLSDFQPQDQADKQLVSWANKITSLVLR